MSYGKVFIVCFSFAVCFGARIPRQVSNPSKDEEFCKAIIGNATKCEKPIALFLGGGTSSGKGALTPKWQPIMQKEGCNYAHIDTNDIKTRLREWNVFTTGEKLQKCGANLLHEASSRIAKKCFTYMVENGYNVVYDATMGGYREAFNRVQKAEQHHYTTQMFSVTVDTPEAAKRAMISAETNKQYVPLCEIVESHAKFSANYRTYLALIPNNKLYDTFSKEPTLIVDNNRILDAERFKTFLDKATQTMESVLDEMEPAMKKQYQELHDTCEMCVPEEEVWLTTSDQAICKVLYRDAVTCEKPIVVYIGGGTASGKSTIAHEVVFKQNNCGYARIDVDVVMPLLEDWNKLTTGDKAKCAATQLFKKASTIAYRCYLQALDENLNVVYDGTYSNYNMSVERVENAKERGYEAYLFGVTVNTATAAERAWKSAEKTKQYVPLCDIIKNHAGFSRNYPELVTQMKRNKLYDNNGSEGVVIMENGKVNDEQLVKEFQAKADQAYDDVKGKMDKSIVDQYEEYHKLCNVCQH